MQYRTEVSTFTVLEHIKMQYQQMLFLITETVLIMTK